MRMIIEPVVLEGAHVRLEPAGPEDAALREEMDRLREQTERKELPEKMEENSEQLQQQQFGPQQQQQQQQMQQDFQQVAGFLGVADDVVANRLRAEAPAIALPQFFENYDEAQLALSPLAPVCRT